MRLARSKYPDGMGFGGGGDGPRDLRTPGIVPPPSSLLVRYTTSIAIIISILLRYTPHATGSLTSFIHTYGL